MDNTDLKLATDLALTKGFDYVKRVNDWNGYAVFFVCEESTRNGDYGYPNYVIVKNGKARFAEFPNEVEAIMRSSNEEEGEDDRPDWVKEIKRRNEGDDMSTEMHYEFFADKVSHFDFMVAATFGDIRRGYSKEEAAKRNKITVEDYEKNIERVLNDPSW